MKSRILQRSHLDPRDTLGLRDNHPTGDTDVLRVGAPEGQTKADESLLSVSPANWLPPLIGRTHTSSPAFHFEHLLSSTTPENSTPRIEVTPGGKG